MKTKLLTRMRSRKKRKFYIDWFPGEDHKSYCIIYKGILPLDIWVETVNEFETYEDAESKINELVDELIRLEL